jgi:hypothetical protein
MNRIAALLITLIAFSALAQDDKAGGNVTFSKHTPALQLASYDERTHTHKFRGTIKLRGTLFVVFDMDAPDRANGEINFEKFVPDPDSMALLPAVVQGFYPGSVRHVNLNAPLDQVEILFGGKQAFARLSHGTSHEVSKSAEVVLDNYSATVECESRIYWGRAVSVAPLVETQQIAATKQVPHGC